MEIYEIAAVALLVITMLTIIGGWIALKIIGQIMFGLAYPPTPPEEGEEQ